MKPDSRGSTPARATTGRPASSTAAGRRSTSPRIELNGAVDEAQAALGVARAEAEAGSELDELLVALERDLYVLMAEVATAPAHRRKLVAGLDAGHRPRW